MAGTGTDHHVRLAELFADLRDELDACKADGLAIPPVASVAAANLAIVLIVIRGQETGEAEDPQTAAAALLTGARP